MSKNRHLGFFPGFFHQIVRYFLCPPTADANNFVWENLINLIFVPDEKLFIKNIIYKSCCPTFHQSVAKNRNRFGSVYRENQGRVHQVRLACSSWASSEREVRPKGHHDDFSRFASRWLGCHW